MRRVGVMGGLTAVLVLAGCSSQLPTAAPSPTASSPTVSVAEHESGPESPIAFGLAVPIGATQLGPLARMRSATVIQAYDSDLRAAAARKAISDGRRDARRNPDGTPAPTPPTPPAVAKPSADSFDDLDEPPTPDITISLMRVDDDPNDVVRRMAGQIAAALPDQKLKPNDIASYCTLVENVVQGCRLTAHGVTAERVELAITMTVDVGDVANGLALAGSGGKPILTLTIERLGDPRLVVDETLDLDVDESLPALPNAPEWPRLTKEQDPTTPLVGDWRVPLTASPLLRGQSPAFLTSVVRRGAVADHMARAFAQKAGSEIAQDVVEGLNEVRNNYTAVAPDGTRYIGSFVLSARGNYVLVFALPPGARL